MIFGFVFQLAALVDYDPPPFINNKQAGRYKVVMRLKWESPYQIHSHEHVASFSPPRKSWFLCPFFSSLDTFRLKKESHTAHWAPSSSSSFHSAPKLTKIKHSQRTLRISSLAAWSAGFSWTNEYSNLPPLPTTTNPPFWNPSPRKSPPTPLSLPCKKNQQWISRPKLSFGNNCMRRYQCCLGTCDSTQQKARQTPNGKTFVSEVIERLFLFIYVQLCRQFKQLESIYSCSNRDKFTITSSPKLLFYKFLHSQLFQSDPDESNVLLAEARTE